MDTLQTYEFNVQVWFEDECWNYSVVQEFSTDENSRRVEPLSYGTTDEPEEAFALAAEAVREFFNA
jgi:hypothetical protein